MKDLQRSLGWLVLATFVLWLVVVALAGATYVSLCTFRADLQQRVDASRDFLKLHPDGIPGIPRATFEQSIDNQQRTIDSLWLVRCGR